MSISSTQSTPWAPAILGLSPIPKLYKTKIGDVAVKGLGSDIPPKLRYRSLQNGTLIDGKAIGPKLAQRKPASTQRPPSPAQNSPAEIDTIDLIAYDSLPGNFTYVHTFKSAKQPDEPDLLITVNEQTDDSDQSTTNDKKTYKWISFKGYPWGSTMNLPGFTMVNQLFYLDAASRFFDKTVVEITLTFVSFDDPGPRGRDKFYVESLDKLKVLKQFAKHVKLTLVFPNKRLRLDKSRYYWSGINYANTRGLARILSEYEALESLEISLKSDVLGTKEVEYAIPFYKLPFTDWKLLFVVPGRVEEAPEEWVAWLLGQYKKSSNKKNKNRAAPATPAEFGALKQSN